MRSLQHITVQWRCFEDVHAHCMPDLAEARLMSHNPNPPTQCCSDLYMQRADLHGRAQDVLKRRLNVTLPELEMPEVHLFATWIPVALGPVHAGHRQCFCQCTACIKETHATCWLFCCMNRSALEQMLSNFTILGISANKTDRIGVKLRKAGFRPKHPVVIIPGKLCERGSTLPVPVLRPCCFSAREISGRAPLPMHTL